MSGELIARLNAYPKMKTVLDTLPPKMLSLASGKKTAAVEMEALDLNLRVEQVVEGIGILRQRVQQLHSAAEDAQPASNAWQNKNQ